MKKTFFSLLLPLSLSGCLSSETTCGDVDAKEAVQIALKDGLEKLIAQNSSGPNGDRLLGIAKIRAHVSDLKIDFLDVRTTKSDPNSTTKFCTAQLKVVISADELQKATEARSLLGLEEIDDFMAKRDISKGADSLSTEIAYSVQPTDDGDKVFAEVDDFEAQLGGISEVIASALFASRIKESALREQQAKELAEKELEDALNQKRQADLEEASALRKMSMDAINALWSGLDPDTRRNLLPEQRAWIKRHTTECRFEALRDYQDPTERKAAQFRCERKATDQRSIYLRRYLSYDRSQDW